jgi:hypothetical protein
MLGESITGAAGKNEKGRRIALLLDVATPYSWLDVGVEAFRNQIVADGLAFNCVHDDQISVPDPTRKHKVCFLAASQDIAAGGMVGFTARRMTHRINPVASLKMGAANYTLTRDPADTNSGVDYSTHHIRAVYKATFGVVSRLGAHIVSLDAGLFQGFGRGAGTNHIPISLSVLF